MRKFKLLLLCTVSVLTFWGCGAKQENSVELVENTESTTGVPSGQIEQPQTNDTLVSQVGPFGKISITIPDGWKYELYPIESEELIGGRYGIHLYPENATDGYVELVYNDSFGVCGTALEQEEVTLAGDTACVGTFENHKYWDFVAFRGKNEGVIAQNVSPDGWWEEGKDQVLDILDTLRFEPDVKEGAASIYYEDSEAYDIGLSLNVENISATGATILYNQYADKASGQLQYGEEYTIEKKENDKWVEVPVVVEGDYAFHLVAYSIKTGEIAKQDIDWEWLYGALEPGEYRIGKTVNDFRATGDYDGYKLYVHFILN